MKNTLLPFHEIHPELKNKTIPLLVLHGFMGNAQEGVEFFKNFPERRYILLIDLPGHGNALFRNIPALSYLQTFAHVAQAIINILQAREISTCQILGYSMGGRLALFLLCFYPQYFIKAFIESAHPGLPSSSLQQTRLLQDQNLLSRFQQTLSGKDDPSFEEFLHQWYRQDLFGQLYQHPLYSDLIDKRLKNCPQELSRGLNILSIGRQPSLWPALQVNHLPLIYFSGEKDLKYTGVGEELKKLTPHICHYILKNCGHNVHFEKPKEFIEILSHHIN